MKRFVHGILLLIGLVILTHYSYSQSFKKYEFGNGIQFLAKDSSFYSKMSVRIQNRYDGIYTENADPTYESRFFIARGRLKFDGFVLTPKLIYKIEFDIVGGYVRGCLGKVEFL